MTSKSVIIPLLVLICFFSGCISSSYLDNVTTANISEIKDSVSEEQLHNVNIKDKINSSLIDINSVEISLSSNYNGIYSQNMSIPINYYENLYLEEDIITILESIETTENYNVTYYGEIAHTISMDMKNNGLQEINSSSVIFLKDYDTFKKEMGTLNRAIDTINENSDMDIKNLDINKAVHNDFLDLLNKGGKYVPLISSYNQLIVASHYVLKNQTNELYVKSFYIAAGMLAADILLLESGVMYKGAFKSVRFLNSELKLMKVRKYCGNSGYGLLLSNIHWYFRGRMETSKSELYSLIKKECIV